MLGVGARLHLKYWQASSMTSRMVTGLLQLVHAWVMLGTSGCTCPATVAAMDARMIDDATSPGIRV